HECVGRDRTGLAGHSCAVTAAAHPCRPPVSTQWSSRCRTRVRWQSSKVHGLLDTAVQLLLQLILAGCLCAPSGRVGAEHECVGRAPKYTACWTQLCSYCCSSSLPAACVHPVVE